MDTLQIGCGPTAPWPACFTVCISVSPAALLWVGLVWVPLSREPLARQLRVFGPAWSPSVARPPLGDPGEVTELFRPRCIGCHPGIFGSGSFRCCDGRYGATPPRAAHRATMGPSSPVLRVAARRTAKRNSVYRSVAGNSQNGIDPNVHQLMDYNGLTNCHVFIQGNVTLSSKGEQYWHTPPHGQA